MDPSSLFSRRLACLFMSIPWRRLLTKHAGDSGGIRVGDERHRLKKERY